MTKKRKGVFVIACGGTGGHLFPGISVAEELKRRGHRAVLLVSEKKIDAVALENHPDLERQQITMRGMPKWSSPTIIKFLWEFQKALKRCGKILDDVRADAVLGMGGFTSMPPIVAARKRKLPSFVHESNAIPGKANRFTAKFCDEVFVGFDECTRHFPNRVCHVVGTPIREALLQHVNRQGALAHFGLVATKKTILVMGGSQGAQGLNRLVGDALTEFDPTEVQFLHFSGGDDEGRMRDLYDESGFTYHLAAFCGSMEKALAVADVAVSRAGASSITEIAYFGIPSVLIPYPFAADDHQTKNASALSREGAAVLAPQEGLTGVKLATILKQKLLPPMNYARIQENLRKFSSESANIKICDIMETKTG